MNKVVEFCRKAARIIVVICLLVLAAFQIVALFKAIGSGPFMASIYNVLKTTLLVVLYLVPAILLMVKKDKEGLVTLAFLLGYLVLSNAIGFMGYAAMINSSTEALLVINYIILFILGVLFAITIIFLLIDKGFGTKLMKLGNFLLVASLFVIILAVVFDVICRISYDMGFGDFLENLLLELITPLVVVFGLILVGNE